MTTLIWYWGRRGSGPLHCAQLTALACEMMPAQKFVVSYSEDGETPALLPAGEYIRQGISTQQSLNSPLSFLMSLPALRAQFRAVLERHKPSSIIVPMAFAALPALVDIPKCMGIPLTYCLHDPKPHAGDPTAFLHALPQRWIVHNTARILCMSEASAAITRSFYPHKPVETLPLLALYEGTSAQKTPISPIKFLFVGRLQAYKGLATLATALALLPTDGWQLTLAGEARDEAAVRQLFAAFPQVTLKLGWLTHSEIGQLYISHDILLATYANASQSGPVAQAIAAAMPCVVTPVGALAEQIGFGQAGWITRDTSAGAIAETLVHVLNTPSEYAAKSSACTQLCASTRQQGLQKLAYLFE